MRTDPFGRFKRKEEALEALEAFEPEESRPIEPLDPVGKDGMALLIAAGYEKKRPTVLTEEPTQHFTRRK